MICFHFLFIHFSFNVFTCVIAMSFYLLWKCGNNLENPITSDLNECSTGNGGCLQLCINSIGSYRCSCRPGFVLNSDNRTCSGMHLIQHVLIIWMDNYVIFISSDINECNTNNGGCLQNCNNAFGSYSCSCRTGFVLNGADNRTCSGTVPLIA